MVGTSRGGEGALLVASHYPEIGSVVSISGSGLVFPDPWSTDVIPAWTWQGTDIPHVPVDAQTDDDLRVGEIAVERINGPILLLSGEDDELWPSVYLSQFAWDRLEREGHAFADQFLRYPGCGHAFVTPFQPIQPNLRPFGNGLMMGGTLVGSANAARSSWAAIRQHLASSLTS